MKKKEVQQLNHGLYRIFWKSGGCSLAAVGNMPNGDKWMAPINWVSPGTSARRMWKEVKNIEQL